MPEPHKEIVNGCEFWMLPVKGGAFRMGSDTTTDSDAYADEEPAHQVVVHDFYLGQFPVTQALWRAVVQAGSVGVTGSHPDTASLDPNPSSFKHDDKPVEQVSWDDAQVFLSANSTN